MATTLDASLSTEDMVSRARVISEALPFMQRYDDRTIVVKYGGHAMGDQALARAFARDIVLLKQSGMKPIVVHGGGPQIGSMLEKLGIKSEFRDGLRVTDKVTMEIVEMVLAGAINKSIVSAINSEGGNAVGLCGKDGNMVLAEKVKLTKRNPATQLDEDIDLGFVGDPVQVNPTLLNNVAQDELIPVVAPVAPGVDGETYNVNADTFAGAIAGAMNAVRLLFLTDVPGVLDKQGRLIKELSITEAKALIADGTVSGGMIPKVETCIEALERGVEAVVIVNGKTPHSVLLEIFTEHGAGTLITR